MPSALYFLLQHINAKRGHTTYNQDIRILIEIGSVFIELAIVLKGNWLLVPSL